MPRPRLPLISKRSAVQSALQVIDAEGLERFSLEKLARHMGVKSPSLYHHFDGRADLLTEAARSLLADIPLGNDPRPGEWTEWFVALSMRTYRHLMQHPRASQLLFSYFPASSVMPSHERGAQILAEVGVPPEARYPIMRGLEKLLFGMVLADADDMQHGREPHPRGIDTTRFPHLVEALEATTSTREEIAERAIRLYLTGVAHEYTARN